MEIARLNEKTLVIKGSIKKEIDYQEIKRHVAPMLEGGIKNLEIKILDATSITSSVLGYFLKLIHKDKIELVIEVGDDRLFRLFQELSLAEAFRLSYLNL